MKLILASSSPRRREILSYFSLPFEIINPDFIEESVEFNNDPEDLVRQIAIGKAKCLQNKDSIILAADTLVYKDGKVYGKPKNEEEAFQFINELQGGWHTVYSGVAVSKENELFSGIEKTNVLFNPLSKKQIQQYLNALHWADKAGGFTIQLAGSLIVKKIDGCYYNVMGLPVNLVQKLLKKMGIDLWDHMH